ncbi:MAG TPA: ferritin-like protein, partial [Solirubrobacteraceae bacterium]|nr:ferritin-like protein [Solirubrobacteraceae bacterium]
ELFAGLDTPDGLKTALQAAIELEHATIPPYLYAVFSLEEGSNAEIAKLVDSVVKEEMAHMALACNVLNAIGGEPEIDTPQFIPTYPGALPGTVEEQLIVHLRPFSIAQVEETFMVIEEPEEPLAIPDPAVIVRQTIGEFYAKIQQQIEAAGEAIFVGDHSRQVTGGFREVIAVTDVKSASTAIETIVEQGEGTKTSPLGDKAGDELAHYYRFAEIAKGRKLIPAPHQQPPWRYEGEAIPFDPTHVYPAVEDPHSSDYPPGSPARRACEECNYTYTSLLKLLHEVFNGAPTHLGKSIGVMNELATQAEKLMTIKLPSGKNAGPSFEYQPNPPS